MYLVCTYNCCNLHGFTLINSGLYLRKSKHMYSNIIAQLLNTNSFDEKDNLKAKGLRFSTLRKFLTSEGINKFFFKKQVLCVLFLLGKKGFDQYPSNSNNCRLLCNFSYWNLMIFELHVVVSTYNFSTLFSSFTSKQEPSSIIVG